MKAVFVLCCACSCLISFAQTHDIPAAEAMKGLAFMKGDWVGKQDFNTGGAPMVGDATNHIDEAIGGRYLEERLSTTLPDRKPTDTRHLLTFDPKSGTYRAWWFNDTSVAPMEFEGKLEDGKLELTSKPTASGAILRATYSSPVANKLVLTFEMKQGEKWQLLFTSSYTKKG